nr:hypothetical protein [Enterobacteriaceae bacterium]UCK59593.1 hypothetical protein [Klebsiella pneumoniae]URZ91886.1 hypothetical protein [Klebsiella pneumoniae]
MIHSLLSRKRKTPRNTARSYRFAPMRYAHQGAAWKRENNLR